MNDTEAGEDPDRGRGEPAPGDSGDGYAEPLPAPAPRAGSDHLFGPVGSLTDAEPEQDVSLARPYAWTRGRTEPSVPLEVETMVSTAVRYDADRVMGMEHHSVAELCRHPHSVAEVAAKLSVPLGVARVLLSEMAELGLVKVHRTVAGDDVAADLVLMERVLRGLRGIE